jgi:hypothetical protein
MTEEEIEQLVNQICEGKFIFKGIRDVNYSQGHPFTIGSKHVVHASNKFGGMLGEEAIHNLEKNSGPSCAHPGCNAYYDDHKTDKGLFLQLLRNLENKEAADTLYQLRLRVLEPEKMAGIAFVDTDEKYRIAPPKTEGGQDG